MGTTHKKTKILASVERKREYFGIHATYRRRVLLYPKELLLARSLSHSLNVYTHIMGLNQRTWENLPVLSNSQKVSNTQTQGERKEMFTDVKLIVSRSLFPLPPLLVRYVENIVCVPVYLAIIYSSFTNHFFPPLQFVYKCEILAKPNTPHHGAR